MLRDIFNNHVGPFLKGEFLPCEALAKSLCRRFYPYLKLLLTLRLAHRLYPPLYESFHEEMYRIGDQVFIGRGYPLSSKKDVLRIVQHCGISQTKPFKKGALGAWTALQTGPAVIPKLSIIDQTKFDNHVASCELPRIEREILGVHPAPGQARVRPFHPIRSYVNLSDELKVVVLYLHYRLGTSYRDALHALIDTLDWDYLERIIKQPSKAVDTIAAIDTARQLSAVLPENGNARQFVLGTLGAQSVVGHRALAQEYEYIHGIPFEWSPTNCNQENLLEQARMFFVPASEPKDKLSALCLSGGIRSASFCLGAIQTLAAHGLFGRFHYLSTVSGGGYIGTALTRWMEAKVASDRMSAQEALTFAEAELAKLRSLDYVRDRMTGRSFEQEGPLTWLRMNSNYLARRLALFSADAWTIVATYLRNLLIVWFIFWPWVAVFLFLPWFAVWLGRTHTFAGGSMLFGIVGAVLGALGATYFYQGVPDCARKKYANLIGWPRGGDNRAALGAVMLVVSSFLLSYAMWTDIDKPHPSPDMSGLLHDYRYIVWAIVITQFPLALGNTEWFAISFRLKFKSLVAMIAAAVLSSAVQAVLIVSVRLGLDRWHLYLEECEAGGISLASMERSLVTPALVLLALLIGEAVKAAMRSWTEKADRREH